jgi:Domain of unknown function (DUF1995)
MTLAKSFEETIDQAKQAAIAALNDGFDRVQIELVFPEIALQAQNLALEFTSIFSPYGSGLRVLFPDTGAAALARRDWGETPFKVGDIGNSRSPVEFKISDTDEAFLVVCPSSVEVAQVEKLCNLANGRPVVLLIPQLEDVSIVGIGYAARQLRERFISTLYSAYYFRPLEGVIVYKNHPSKWEVWLEETKDNYKLIAEESQKPLGEYLERIIMEAVNPTPENPEVKTNLKKPGLMGNLQRFLRALSN